MLNTRLSVKSSNREAKLSTRRFRAGEPRLCSGVVICSHSEQPAWPWCLTEGLYSDRFSGRCRPVMLSAIATSRAVISGCPWRSPGGLRRLVSLASRRREPEFGVEGAVVASGQPVGRCAQDRAAPVGQDVVDGEQGR